MATTTKPQTAILKINWKLNTGDDAYDLGITKSVFEVTHFDKRVLEAPGTGGVEISFAELLADGADWERGGTPDPDLILIVNEDTTEDLRLRLQADGGSVADIKIPKGGVFPMFNRKFGISTSQAVFAGYTDIDTLKAQSLSANVCKFKFIILTSQFIT